MIILMKIIMPCLPLPEAMIDNFTNVYCCMHLLHYFIFCLLFFPFCINTKCILKSYSDNYIVYYKWFHSSN